MPNKIECLKNSIKSKGLALKNYKMLDFHSHNYICVLKHFV